MGNNGKKKKEIYNTLYLMPLFKLLSRCRDESVGIFNSGLLKTRLKLTGINSSPKKKKNQKRPRFEL